MVVGKAIDAAVSRLSHEAGLGRRPTTAAMLRLGAEVLEEEIRDADLEVPEAERERSLAAIRAVLKAFRKSVLFGLDRPRSRMILINGSVGIYAQPDFWDRRARFYEFKSYRAIPVPPDVDLQLQLFQLAFPRLVGVLACFPRHVDPVEVTLLERPPISPETARDVLERCLAIGLAEGEEKVLEYVDNPMERYEV